MTGPDRRNGENSHSEVPEPAGEPTDVEARTAGDSAGPGEGGPPDQQLAEKDALVADLQNQILYLHAELENFKRRTQKRYREALDFATEPLLKDLLPVLDNLERATEHARDDGGVDSLVEGLGHVISQFRDALAKHDVEPIEAEGEKFDPTLHEAMFQIPGEEDGRVASVYEKGYRLKGRLLRPAKVAVTKVASTEGDG